MHTLLWLFHLTDDISVFVASENHRHTDSANRTNRNRRNARRVHHHGRKVRIKIKRVTVIFQSLFHGPLLVRDISSNVFREPLHWYPPREINAFLFMVYISGEWEKQLPPPETGNSRKWSLLACPMSTPTTSPPIRYYFCLDETSGRLFIRGPKKAKYKVKMQKELKIIKWKANKLEIFYLAFLQLQRISKPCEGLA